MSDRADAPRGGRRFRPRLASIVIGIGAVVLCALHQDQWWWDDGTLVLGFMPVALAYHVLYSLLAATLWACACWFAWPRALEIDPAGEDSAG